MLLLSILTFVTVVLIMTGALVPVLMYCGVILVVLYVLVLIKNLFVSLFSPLGDTTLMEFPPEDDEAGMEDSADDERPEAIENDALDENPRLREPGDGQS